MAQDGFLDHCGRTVCTFTCVAVRPWSLHESVHATCCLGHSPEGSEEVQVVPGGSESVNGSCLIVLSLLYIVFSFLSAPQHVDPLMYCKSHWLKSKEAPDAISVAKISGSSDAPEVG